ncbi:hypothetical protein D3C73_990160 [compost metagenome]
MRDTPFLIKRLHEETYRVSACRLRWAGFVEDGDEGTRHTVDIFSLDSICRGSCSHRLVEFAAVCIDFIVLDVVFNPVRGNVCVRFLAQ